MNKHTLFRNVIVATSLLVLVVLAACAAPSSAWADTRVTTIDEIGSTTIEPVALSNARNSITVGALSEIEIDGLLYMREEEKLAHDVYLALSQQWGLPIFQNIANSEQTHTNAVKTLLDRYNLSDPAAGQGVGDFTNPTLQGLYDQLVAEGSQSLANALRVGATVEEIDILDLEKHIAETDQAGIKLVYENLMKGSRNHLRAFASTLKKQTGETYQPQYLDQAAYQAIINTPPERGRAG